MGGDGKRTKLPWLGVARDVDDDGGPFTNCSSDLHIFDDDDDAIRMVLRPVELDLSVASCAVSVERPESPSAASLVKYKVTLRAFNPSGRVVQESHFVTKSAFLNASALPASLAARLYDGETDQVVVQAVASLSFTIGGARGVSAGKRGHNFTLIHCWPVSISSYYEVSGGKASCSQDTTEAAVAGLTHDRYIGGPCPETYKNSGKCSRNSTGIKG
ncbi:hypothetical protein OsI_21407 [Oryza sativa Indica Group]|uniref:Uncharacterized protein n=1 Tax=Oryza sativa subsp. indica TaxID=39946 RepID=B8B1W3_ORYSI|nr:hypothetical protein OsI_21407 [Oryza sativa Indica Group]